MRLARWWDIAVLKILQSVVDCTFVNSFLVVELKNLASNKLIRIKFPALKANEGEVSSVSLRRHLPIRLRSWRFERSSFVVTCRLYYDADGSSVSLWSALADYITKLTVRAFALRQSKWTNTQNVSFVFLRWKFDPDQPAWYLILVFHFPNHTVAQIL